MTGAPNQRIRHDSTRVAAIAAFTVAGLIAMHSMMEPTVAERSSGPHHESHVLDAGVHGVTGACVFVVGTLALAVIATPGRVRLIRRRPGSQTLPIASARPTSGRLRHRELCVIQV